MKQLKTEQLQIDFRSLFEHDEGYQKPVRVGNLQSNNYIQYESNGDRNKTLSIEEYFNKIRPYLKDIKNDFNKSDTWEIELTIELSFCLQNIMVKSV